MKWRHMKYRKKPVVIDAEQYSILMSRPLDGVCYQSHDGTNTGAHIHTLEGIHTVSDGDWIIKGVKGEYYPCKPDIFEMTYEKVE